MTASYPSKPEVDWSHGDLEHGSSDSSNSREDGSLRKSRSSKEKYLANNDVVRDIIIGFADGLTVPFALTAGLSSIGSSQLVIIGGLAELVSGAISMGLGAYLAAVTERDRYISEEERERREMTTMTGAEKQEKYEIFAEYGVDREASKGVVDSLARDEENWVRFMMSFELKLEKPNVSRAWISAASMGLSYFVGGLLPMIPYFALPDVNHALFISIAVTGVILLTFGYTKTYVTVRSKRAAFFGAFQTLLIGALAASASYGIVRGIDHARSACG